MAVGKPGHVHPGPGHHHIGGQDADPGDSADRLPEALKRLDHNLDPAGDLVDRGGVPVEQVQVDPGEKGVVLGETAVEGLGQLGIFDRSRRLARSASPAGSRSPA